MGLRLGKKLVVLLFPLIDLNGMLDVDVLGDVYILFDMHTPATFFRIREDS